VNYEVLIPAHGESAWQIETLLFSLFAQRSRQFKLSRILLCSDNPELQAAFSDRALLDFVSQEPGYGKPQAINLMLARAREELCVEISADCLPAGEQTLDLLLQGLLDPDVGAVTSRPVPGNYGFMGLPNLVWKCHTFVQPKLNAEMFGIKRSLMEPLPFRLVHDDAWIHALLERKGYSVVYEPRAMVFNSVPETLREFYLQRKKNVIGNLQLARDFREFIPTHMRLRALLLMSLELLANLHGRLDYVRGQIPRGLMGYNLKTTKNVQLKQA
jgi:glycosyl transferase family 2